MVSIYRKVGHLFWKAYDLVCVWCMYSSALLFFVISVIVVYEVIMRYFFNYPTEWAVVFSEFFLLIGTFLAAPWLLNRGEHTSVTILSDKLRGQRRFVWGIFVSIVGIVTFSFLLWPGILFCIESFQKSRSIYTPMGMIPKYSILWVVPFASVFLIIGFVKLGLQHLGEFKQTKKNKEKEQSLER